MISKLARVLETGMDDIPLLQGVARVAEVSLTAGYQTDVSYK